MKTLQKYSFLELAWQWRASFLLTPALKLVPSVTVCDRAVNQLLFFFIIRIWAGLDVNCKFTGLLWITTVWQFNVMPQRQWDCNGVTLLQTASKFFFCGRGGSERGGLDYTKTPVWSNVWFAFTTEQMTWWHQSNELFVPFNTRSYQTPPF